MRFAVARQAGLTEEAVAMIDDGFAESALSDRHKALIRFADVFLAERGLKNQKESRHAR